MFTDIKIRKYDKDQNIIDTINVPLTFGPITKLEADNLENNYFDLNGNMVNSRYYLTVPRMAVTLDGISYDSSRTVSSNEYRNFYSSSLSATNNTYSDYQPSPFNLSTTLHITSKSLDQFSQILEQFLPYFSPSQVLRVKENVFLSDIERTIPVKLNSINVDMSSDMNVTDTRYINGSVNFTIEIFLYRPFDVTGIIKTINTNIYSYDTSAAISSTTTSASN
jgi:hypothetical protein